MLPRLGKVLAQPTRNASFRSIIQASQTSLKKAAVAPGKMAINQSQSTFSF